MSMVDRLLKRGIEFSKAGKKEDARKTLRAVIDKEPQKEIAWLWYVDTFHEKHQRIHALEELLIAIPSSKKGQLALNSLKQKYQPPLKPVSPPIQDKQPIPQKTPQREKTSLARRSLAVVLASIFLCIMFVAFVEYSTLHKEYQSLQDSYAILSAEHISLKSRHNKLQSSYDTLTYQHNYLLDEYDFLNGEYKQLQTQYGTLEINYNNLLNDYNFLEEEYYDFASTAISPPYILIYNREVYLTYVGTDESVHRWYFPFASLEYAIKQGSWERIYDSSLRFTNNGETIYSPNYRPYINPDPFVNLIPDLYYQSTDEYAFITEVWNIVTQLSNYSADIGDIPRFPLETFLAGGGDCEDTSILFASMILAAPVSWDVSLVYMDAEHPIDPQEVNHVIVSIDTGQRSYSIETTSSQIMEPYINGVVGWFLDVSD